MRRQPLALATTLSSLVLASCLALSGCGQASEQADQSSSSAPVASGSGEAGAQASATTAPQQPDCSSLTIDTSSPALPSVSVEKDDAEPVVTWSGQGEPANLTVATLEEGDGAEVTEADVVKASYAGWQWDSDTTFDSTYTANAQGREPGPIAFPLQQVITAWRCGLAGHHVGDRVLMSAPADLAYGNDASSGRPTGTLVFVVTIVDSIDVETAPGSSKDATMEGEDAVAQRGVTVGGELGAQPTVSVSQGAKEPTQPEALVLARGRGAKVEATSTAALSVVGVYWSGTQTAAPTWQTGQLEAVQVASQGLDGLVGVPQGSRVVLLQPANPTTGQEAAAFVIDIEAVV